MTPGYLRHRAQIIGMLDEQVATYNRWRRAFAEVLDERYYPLTWLDEQVVTGAVKVWGCDNAAIIAELKRYPGWAIDVHGLVAAGDLGGIKNLIGLAEEWGRENGAIAGLVESRLGWMRELKSSGYFPHQVCLRKEFVV